MQYASIRKREKKSFDCNHVEAYWLLGSIERKLFKERLMYENLILNSNYLIYTSST